MTSVSTKMLFQEAKEISLQLRKSQEKMKVEKSGPSYTIFVIDGINHIFFVNISLSLDVYKLSGLHMKRRSICRMLKRLENRIKLEHPFYHFLMPSSKAEKSFNQRNVAILRGINLDD